MAARLTCGFTGWMQAALTVELRLRGKVNSKLDLSCFPAATIALTAEQLERSNSLS